MEESGSNVLISPTVLCTKSPLVSCRRSTARRRVDNHAPHAIIGVRITLPHDVREIMKVTDRGILSIKLANGKELDSGTPEEVASFVDSNGTSIVDRPARRKRQPRKKRVKQ